KMLADKKKDIYDEDLRFIVADKGFVIPEKYTLTYMNVMTGLEGIPGAVVRLRTKDGDIVDSNVGVGSVDAVYNTISEMVDEKFSLLDYSVKSVTGGTDALASVEVKLRSATNEIYTGRGSGMDVIEASAKAYINAVNKIAYYADYNNR
ncbi:MAG: 2-isopropylmalate synthase, partial [Abditibacteriota bacterium]|nr:2-isopropylmalate synthase [Abditibacteriota bacterium]